MPYPPISDIQASCYIVNYVFQHHLQCLCICLHASMNERVGHFLYKHICRPTHCSSQMFRFTHVCVHTYLAIQIGF